MQSTCLLGTLRGMVLGAFLMSSVQPALGKTSLFSGVVEHVSINNIKVKNRAGETLSFLLVPRFGKVFGSDGKITRQLAEIKPGDRVRVYYDQKALGARHADRIVDETLPLKPIKS